MIYDSYEREMKPVGRALAGRIIDVFRDAAKDGKMIKKRRNGFYG